MGIASNSLNSRSIEVRNYRRNYDSGKLAAPQLRRRYVLAKYRHWYLIADRSQRWRNLNFGKSTKLSVHESAKYEKVAARLFCERFDRRIALGNVAAVVLGIADTDDGVCAD